MSIDNLLSERIRSGNFSIKDLEVLMESIDKLKFQPLTVRNMFLKVFESKESIHRLLELVLSDPDSFYELLSRYHVLVENTGTVLYKAYIVSALKKYGLNPKPAPLIEKAIYSLIEAHHYISLYNPLVMLYIALNKPSSLRNAVIKPMADKIELYEANPNSSNLYVFRDAVLFISIIIDPQGVIPLLYNGYEYEWIIDLIEKSGIKVLEPTKKLILTSYLRVLKGLSESLRAITRGLNSLENFEKDLYYIGSARMAVEVLETYIEFTRSYSEKSLKRIISLMNGLIGAGFSNVYETITYILGKELDSAAFIRSNKYLLTAFLLEMSLLSKMYEDGLIEEFDTYEYLEKLVGIVSDKIKRIKNEIILMLDQDLEPYRTLKIRVLENRDSRFLSWLKTGE
ncbi:hypothetical protein [Staphylothermus hellenicus]|uniref:Uncharacterized protein n=1 Tax=Staphylothermus hellenicus (strain DSM 12710 / JCM 10830 / BK20S6-10-b1 / P8) TaxID=591019 RepID=D7DBM5_STAHD|nr:hypothetical protein [Staphylothermus hellenicus]ADI31572.1 hypothetical protein Shell_0441 [Staphylothermus hellenicus DSM 12710]